MPEYVGEPLNRVDGKLKVTGRAVYTADQQVPNLAHAVLITSGIAKGRILSLDSSEAERVPGVIAILSHQTGLKLAKDPGKVDPGSPADRVLQLFQDDRVLYSDQPVAVAIARSFEAARDAALRVKIRYSAETPRSDRPGTGAILRAQESRRRGRSGREQPRRFYRGISRRAGKDAGDLYNSVPHALPDGAARHHRRLGEPGKADPVRHFAGNLRGPEASR